jgi:GNAT superfamily N-acetyltransferase
MVVTAVIGASFRVGRVRGGAGRARIVARPRRRGKIAVMKERPKERRPASRITVRPVTPDRWDDVEKLFGQNGACAGCWCMFFKQSRQDFERKKGAENRKLLRGVVRSGVVPGLLAYDGSEPVGWCAIEPRERYPRLGRARMLKTLLDTPAWAIPCLFVARTHRRRGVSAALVAAAVGHARANGATLVEAYPVVPLSGSMPDAFAYHGLLSAFAKAGFEVVATPSRGRRVVRKALPRRSG